MILLQAGEILRTDAAATFAKAAALCPWAACLTADLDHRAADGTRHAPLFKPGPDPVLLETGLPIRGACAIRWRNVPAALPLHADAAKMILARRAPELVAHIPQILTHIAPEFRSGFFQFPRTTAPLPKFAPATAAPRVTMIVPSAAAGAHVVRCLRKVTTGTNYPAFDVKVILSSPGKASVIGASVTPDAPVHHACRGATPPTRVR